MVTLICICITVFMIGFYFIVGIFTVNKLKKPIYRIAIGLLIIFVGLGSFDFVLDHGISLETCNAVEVAELPANIHIYRDNISGEYFRLIRDDWNIFNIYSRLYIDSEAAEKIIEVAEIINRWIN